MHHDFDDLAMSMSNGGSRRLIVKRLALSALGALGLVSLAEDDAEASGSGIGRKAKKAKKPKKPKKCPPGRKRCGKRCCPKGKVCRNKKCVNKQPTPPPPPACTPVTQAVACEGRECGNVSNGCAGSYDCGTCTGPEVCGPTGACNCTPPQTQEQACAGRDCGTVPNGCGSDYTCGPATCAGTNDQCLAGHCTCVPPQTQQQACDGRECGTMPDGCGSNYTCGTGTCPDLACASAVACDTDGQCIYEASNQGGSCNSGAGMCVDGACEATNPSGTCTGANPCLAPTSCGDTCICYSTIEGAGFCIEQGNAICPSEAERPACSSSAQCADDAVCVPLKETPTSTESCCGAGAQFPGFCVPLAARCNA